MKVTENTMLALCLVIITLGLSAGLPLKNTVLSDTPENKLRELENKLFKGILKNHPEFASSIGFQGYEDSGESFSLGSLENQMSENEGLLAELDAIDPEDLDHKAKMDYKILRNHILTFIQGYKWRMWGYINPISFLQGVFKHPQWLRLWNKRNIFTKRIEYMHIQLKQQLELLKIAVDTNTTNHKYSMDRGGNLINDMEYMLMLFNYIDFFNISDDKASTEVIKNSLREAVREMMNIKHFVSKTYLPATREKEGVSSLPGGLAYYNACLRYHLGLNMTALQVHNLGLREVKRIQKLMKKYMRYNGHGEDLPKFFKYLRSLKHVYNNSQTDMVNRYEKSMQKINNNIWKIFRKIDLHEVRIQPDNISKSLSLGAYHDNTFYLNVKDSENKSIITMLPLTFHEANPGHHFQESYADHQHLPAYRQHLLHEHRYAVPSTYPTYMAYTEGWALYAEHLGLELGLYQNPLDLFGKYCSEMFRACRLVVDTGIHAFGWSRETAVEYMARYTDFPRSELVYEVNRYITWPGHSCSYKIGEMKILELRTRAEKALGKLFDVKEFHHQVLKEGPISLDILEELIDNWIHLLLKDQSESGLAVQENVTTDVTISNATASSVATNDEIVGTEPNDNVTSSSVVLVGNGDNILAVGTVIPVQGEIISGGSSVISYTRLAVVAVSLVYNGFYYSCMYVIFH